MTMNLNPAQLVLSGICAAFLGVLAYLLLAPLPEIAVPQIHARVEPVDEDPPLPRFEPPPKTAFAEVDDRSVFNPARVRVSSPSLAGTSNAATLPSDLALVGVILDGKKQLALIKSPQEPLAVSLGVGGTIEGWQVTRVEPDRVALRAGGPEQQLLLSDNKAAAGAQTNNNAPNGGPNGPGNFRRPPFMRPPGFQRPGMGPNGPVNPNGENVNNGQNGPQNQNQNQNNNNNDNSDDDDNNNNN